MHELGTIYYVIKTVEDLAKEQNLTEVQSITLEVGEVSGIIDSYLLDFWQWARQKSELLKDTELLIEKLDAVTYCQECKQTYPTLKYEKICPYCGSDNTFLVTGNEYAIKEIVAG